MIALKSSQSIHEICLSEAFRLSPGEPIIRFRASFQMGSLPYLTVWVAHIHPVDLVEYFHRVLRLVRDPKTARQEIAPEEFSWRSSEGHLVFHAEESSPGEIRLDCAICTVPRRDSLGTSMTIFATDAAMTAFLTGLAGFFSVDLPGRVMLPEEDWDDWGSSSSTQDVSGRSPKPAVVSDAQPVEDVWLEGHTPAPTSPSQVDLDGWEEE
ncbi:MAG: hypothetical protein H6728_12055 [Myxococcales bacterium]|nr:hypothetical protein [Myxococcales bacterium]